MHKFKQLCAVMAVLCIGTTVCQAQIGNTGWIEGEEVKKDKDSKLQFLFEISVGTSQLCIADKCFGPLDWEEGSSSLMADISLGAAYRIIELKQSSSINFDILLLSLIGANSILEDANDIDRTLRFHLSVGPELGVGWKVGASTILRPFLSFGPGVSFLDVGWNNDDVNFIWELRFGLESKFANGKLSIELGGKKIYFGEYEPDYSWDDSSQIRSENNFLGFIGLRVGL